MKRLLAVLPVGLAIAACGSGAHQVSSPQAQAATAKVDKVISRCLPNPLTLASHGGREKFKQCAVPPGQQQAFAVCLERVALSGVPTKARLTHEVEGCLLKVN